MAVLRDTGAPSFTFRGRCAAVSISEWTGGFAGQNSSNRAGLPLCTGGVEWVAGRLGAHAKFRESFET